MMEEYKTLRSESLMSMQTQQSILRFGTASIGVVLAIGFQFWENAKIFSIIFLVFLPLLSYLILFIWMGEVARMMRAGIYIHELEKKVNSEIKVIKNKALEWENWLRQSSSKENFTNSKKGKT